MTEDTELLQRFVQQDDQEAFGELVRRQVNFVYSAALRQVGGDSHLAQDVTQGVFSALARAAPRLLGRATLGGWLYTTTRHVAAKSVRSHRRWRRREQEAQSMRIIEENGPAEPAWDRLRPVLDAAMHQLNPTDREALLLRYFEGLPFAEVGARCALSENTARMRVERALDKLRTQLEKKGVPSTAAALGLALSSHAIAAAPPGLAAAASGAALAGLSTGSAAGLVQFFLSMSTTKTAAGLAGILCVLAGGSAVYEAAAAHRAETALALDHQSETRRIRELQAQVAALRIRGAAPAAGPMAPARDLRPGAAAASASDRGGGTSAGSPKHESRLASTLAMVNGPVADIPARMQIESQYAPLFKSLNLTPDQIAQFKNLLFEKRTASLDAIAAAASQEIDATSDPQSVYLAVVAAQKDANTQLAALLGPAGVSQYQQYTQDLPAATTGSRLQQTLSYSGNPMTDDQVDRLEQALKQYSAGAVPEPFALLNGDLGLTTLSNQALAAAQSILSAPQLQALQENVAQQHQLLLAREQMK